PSSRGTLRGSLSIRAFFDVACAYPEGLHREVAALATWCKIAREIGSTAICGRARIGTAAPVGIRRPSVVVQIVHPPSLRNGGGFPTERQRAGRRARQRAGRGEGRIPRSCALSAAVTLRRAVASYSMASDIRCMVDMLLSALPWLTATMQADMGQASQFGPRVPGLQCLGRRREHANTNVTPDASFECNSRALAKVLRRASESRTRGRGGALRTACFGLVRVGESQHR